MNLKLEQYLSYEADKPIRCDATSMFWNNSERKEIVFTHNEVASLFYARHSKIYPKDKAVYIEVINLDNGELLHLNCRKDMHELMLKYMLYPPIILNAFK